MNFGIIETREAKAGDAPGIARVHVGSWRTSYAGIVPDSYLARLSCKDSEARWEDRLREAGISVYAAESSEVGIVGFASGGPNGGAAFPTYGAELYAIYLLEPWRRRGVGRTLLRCVVEALTDRGAASMLAWCLADNPSRLFYESLGGKRLGVRTVEIGGRRLGEACYGWRDTRGLRSRLNAGS